MLGNRIKNLIKLSDEKVINVYDCENDNIKNDQLFEAQCVTSIIESIKERIQMVSDRKLNIKFDPKSDYIYISDTKTVFKNDPPHKNIISQSDKDFFIFFNKPIYQKEISEFKKWLTKNRIIKVVISVEYDGSKNRPWNLYKILI